MLTEELRYLLLEDGTVYPNPHMLHELEYRLRLSGSRGIKIEARDSEFLAAVVRAYKKLALEPPARKKLPMIRRRVDKWLSGEGTGLYPSEDE